MIVALAIQSGGALVALAIQSGGALVALGLIALAAGWRIMGDG